MFSVQLFTASIALLSAQKECTAVSRNIATALSLIFSTFNENDVLLASERNCLTPIGNIYAFAIQRGDSADG
jgi:hypothetical protein